jgi:hypothetical protein
VTVKLDADELTELRRLVSAEWGVVSRQKSPRTDELGDLCTKLDEALIEALQSDVRERRLAR